MRKIPQTTVNIRVAGGACAGCEMRVVQRVLERVARGVGGAGALWCCGRRGRSRWCGVDRGSGGRCGGLRGLRKNLRPPSELHRRLARLDPPAHIGFTTRRASLFAPISPSFSVIPASTLPGEAQMRHCLVFSFISRRINRRTFSD
jgi:hypothetical protein